MGLSRKMRAALVIPAIVATLGIAFPGVGAATDPVRRVANLDGDYPGLYPSDPRAEARVVLRLFPDQEQVCYRITWSDMQIRAVYVYRRSTNALVSRIYDQAPTYGPTVRGCTESGVPRAQIREFRRYPGRFYIKASSYDGSEQIAGRMRRPSS